MRGAFSTAGAATDSATEGVSKNGCKVTENAVRFRCLAVFAWAPGNTKKNRSAAQINVVRCSELLPNDRMLP